MWLWWQGFREGLCVFSSPRRQGRQTMNHHRGNLFSGFETSMVYALFPCLSKWYSPFLFVWLLGRATGPERRDATMVVYPSSPRKIKTCREEHSMDRCRSRPQLLEIFESHWSKWNAREIRVDKSLFCLVFKRYQHGPMTLKISREFPPRLALVHGWLFQDVKHHHPSPK